MTEKYDDIDEDDEFTGFFVSNPRPCNNIFKDSSCRYFGAENDCDKSLLRCKQLNNELNFNSFPRIPVKLNDPSPKAQ